MSDPRETVMGDVGYIAAVAVCRLFARYIVGEQMPRHTLAGRARDDWFVRTRECRTLNEAIDLAREWDSTSIISVDDERIVMLIVFKNDVIAKSAFNYKLTEDGVATSMLATDSKPEFAIADLLDGFNKGLNEGENTYEIAVGALGEYADPKAIRLESGYHMLDDPEEQESV